MERRPGKGSRHSLLSLVSKAPESALDDALIKIQMGMEQVLSFQRHVDRNVKELMAGQCGMRDAIEALSRSPAPGQFRSEDAKFKSEDVITEDCIVLRPRHERGSVDVDSIVERPRKGSLDRNSIVVRPRNERGSLDGNSIVMRSRHERGSIAESVVSRGTRWGDDVSLADQSMSVFGTSNRVGDEGVEGAPSIAALNACFAYAPFDILPDEVDQKLERLMGEKERLVHSGSASSVEISGSSCLLDPHCRMRVAHDLLSLFALAVDFATLPVVVAWDVSEDGILLVIRVVSVCFWLWDMPMSFLTSFYVQGELERRPYRVAKRYFKSWLLPDICIILFDVVTLLGSGSGLSGFLRAGRVGRFVRLVRLFRGARASDVIVRLTQASAILELAVEIARPLVCIAVITHMLACALWSVSNAPSDTGMSWAIPYAESAWLYQYFSCLHWSVAHLLMGSMDLAPANSAERGVSCVTLLLGMFMFSSVVSSLSSKMMQQFLRQKDRLTKLHALRRFLESKVPHGLSSLVQLQAQKILSRGSGKPETMQDVAAIALLPQAMQRKIRVELCAKHLRHPVFRWWFAVDSTGAQALCHNAIDFMALAEDDHLFFPHADAIGAYVMTSGMAKYVFETSNHRKLTEEIQQADFFCEAALWCNWKHVGEVTATTGCELLSITANGLSRCADEDRVVRHVVVLYARHFKSRLTAAFLAEMEQPNDLMLPLGDFDSILPALPLTCRQLIGAAALNVAVGKKFKRSFNAEQKKEVTTGKCCLMLNWDGEVEGITAVNVLHLVDDDGRVLVQLAEWDGQQAKVQCKLPGKKLEVGMGPDEALARLLHGAYAPFRTSLRFTHVMQEIAWGHSKTMNFRTKYVRTLNYANLTVSVDALELEDLRVCFLPKRCSIVNVVESRVSLPWVHSTPSVISGVTAISSARSAMDSAGSAASAGTASLASSTSLFASDLLDVFALADGTGRLTFACWLSTEDRNYYTSPEGEERLQEMLKTAVVEPGTFECAEARFAAAEGTEGPLDTMPGEVRSLLFPTSSSETVSAQV